MHISTKQTTLSPYFTSASHSAALLFLAKMVGASLFIAACAKVTIPFYPVPMTMQPFALIALSLMLSPKLAMASVITYLLEVAAGLPVNANMHAGLSIFAGPTGGYLVGFIPLTYLISTFKRDNMSMMRLFGVALLGQAALYACGLIWLSTLVGAQQAVALGLVPFLVKIPATNAFALFTYSLGKDILQKFKR